MRDPRTPWYAKVLGGLVVAYAFSPVDLIPDYIPVLGYLDDLILVPLGVALVVRLIPSDVYREARARAETEVAHGRRVNWIAGGVIIALWVAAAAAVALAVIRRLRQ
jgi:uncharacterized membrane protein YkvA (DUF1232 family)